MKHKFLLMGTLISAAVLAQEPTSFEGKWHFEFISANGYAVAGTLTVQGQGGIWASNATSRNNPCLGRPTPITVRTASADSLAFEINGSKVINGCQDNQVQVKRIDATHLEGTIDQSVKMKLTRE
jgi:hypothetical protein